MADTLDISVLRNAVAELDGMYRRASTITSDPELARYLRTAVVKGFEYSYEASHKTIRRFLDLYGPARADDTDYLFPELLRIARDHNLIEDVAAWMEFRKKRNTTSHAYDIAKAETIYAAIPDFLRHARGLIERLDRQMKATP